jgi:hypothetical protein
LQRFEQDGNTHEWQGGRTIGDRFIGYPNCVSQCSVNVFAYRMSVNVNGRLECAWSAGWFLRSHINGRELIRRKPMKVNADSFLRLKQAEIISDKSWHK